MAHLWLRDAEGQLRVFPLHGDLIDLTTSPPRRG